MSAFEKAKSMNTDELYAMAEGLCEYGIDNTAVTDKWKKVDSERGFWPYPIRAVAALNNGDLKRVLINILKEKHTEIFEGLSIAALAVNAEEKVLYIPESEKELSDSLADEAASYGVRIELGMADVRRNRGSLFHHYATLIALSQVMEGTYWPAVYVAVQNAGRISEPAWVEYGTTIGDIIAGHADVDEIRAVAVGNHLFSARDAIGLKIGVDVQAGNGVITIYPKTSCMVHETGEILKEYRKASCGKCTFCREGLIQLSTLNGEITSGRGQKDAPGLMKEIGEAMAFSTQCTLGEDAATFMLDAIELFGDEFNEHISKKKCGNNVCQAFSSIYIDPDECQGCEECADVCPVYAIEGKKGFIHIIDEYECTKCGKCIEACEYDAIIQTTGRVPRLPSKLVKVGKFKTH